VELIGPVHYYERDLPAGAARMQNFPALIVEKVPQVKTYKFFVIQNKIVVVSPQDNVVADLIQ